MTEYFWTFIDSAGEIFDAEFADKAEAHVWADEAFCDECLDEGGWKNGQTASAEIELIKFHYDENGERRIVEREKTTVDFEYYHGDYAEHSVWHSGGGGVL